MPDFRSVAYAHRETTTGSGTPDEPGLITREGAVGHIFSLEAFSMPPPETALLPEKWSWSRQRAYGV